MDEKKPYPRGFTCFNRLFLALYPSRSVQETYLKAIANSQLDGMFGL